MKNINTTKINEEQNDKIAFVALKIADWKNEKALKSLWNPNDIVEAKANLVKIMMWNSKYKYDLVINDWVLNNILYLIFEKNIDVNSAIETFKRQKSPIKAEAQVNSVVLLWEIANNTYRPENKVDYSWFDEAVA